jgi:signal transduction histidine kinase
VLGEMAGELELPSLLAAIVRDACELLRADDGAIGIHDPARGLLRIEAAWRMPEGEVGSEFLPGQGLAGQVLLTRQPVLCPRYAELVPDAQPALRENPVLGLPLFWRDRLVGFFGIGARPPRRFDQEDVETLSLFGGPAAMAIELALQHRRAQTQSRELQQRAVQEERARLARDLHDSVTQLLSSATLIAQSVAPAYARDPEEGTRRIARVVEVNRAALAEMRALLRELAPSAPELAVRSGQSGEMPIPGFVRVRTEGLAAVLAGDLEALSRDGIAAHFVDRAVPRLTGAVAETLYRISQEALANAVKHARARCVEVRLELERGECLLTIQDDGEGFDPREPRPEPGRGLGLPSMRERAARLGGSLQLESRPGHGTCLAVRIPLEGGAA